MAALDKYKSELSMNLFGVPYQFTETVDPRNSNVNNTVGLNFMKNILQEAPVITIIPGRPIYLPSHSDEKSVTAALLDAADKGSSAVFRNLNRAGELASNEVRLYDFKKDYVNYMNTVNFYCRVGASWLGVQNYQLYDTINKKSTYLNKFDWKNYKWYTGQTGATGVLSKLVHTSNNPELSNMENEVEDTGDLADVLEGNQYIQFYVNPDGTGEDSFGNDTKESAFKNIFDSVSNNEIIKELSWMMQSNAFGEGASDVYNSLDDAGNAFSGFIGDTLSGPGGTTSAMGSVLSSIFNMSGNILKGDNVVIPNVYQNSRYNKASFNVSINLRTPYGNILSYYLNIFVPLMHLLPLVAPRQSSANTYNCPFLVKAWIEGSNTCNLGLVTSMTVSRDQSTRSIDGLPSSVTVNLTFEDLYSDLSITPSSALNIKYFLANTPLVDYLATNCGMSLTAPNLKKKIDVYTTGYGNILGDVIPNARSVIDTGASNLITSFLSLSR